MTSAAATTSQNSAAPAGNGPAPESVPPAKSRCKWWRIDRLRIPPSPIIPRWYGWLPVALGIFILTFKITGIGLDARSDAFAWASQPRGFSTLNAAVARAQSIIDFTHTFSKEHSNWNSYRQALHGEVEAYNRQDLNRATIGNEAPDSAPLGMMLFVHWVKSAQGAKNLSNAVAGSLLKFNSFCEGVTALLVFALVWIWMERRPRDPLPAYMKRWMLWPLQPSPAITPSPLVRSTHWRDRWGDPLLLAPVILLIICIMLRPFVSFTPTGIDTKPVGDLDDRVVSIGFWMFAVLRFISAVCLARFLPRPFRAPVCAAIAASIVWLNPALIIADHGWPAWDVWALPLFLAAAILVSFNRWLSAGIILAIGCLFRGQTIWAAPVLILCPLIAGYPGKFLRILGGFLAAAAVGLWPWFVTSGFPLAFVIVAVSMAALVCLAAIFWPWVVAHLGRLFDPIPPNADMKHHARRYLPTVLGAIVFLTGFICILVKARHASFAGAGSWTILFLLVMTVPMLLPKRLLYAWLVFVFGISAWLAAFHFGGNPSVWRVGYAFATEEYQTRAYRSHTLGNVQTVMSQKFAWKITDELSSFHIPFTHGLTKWTVGESMLAIDIVMLILIAGGAALQLRKNDSKFLIALAAPWLVTAALIAPLPANFLVVGATAAALLVGVSTGLSLMQLLTMLFAWAMVLAQMLPAMKNAAPATINILRPTAPDLGWALPLAAAVFVYCTLLPGRQLSSEDPLA